MWLTKRFHDMTLYASCCHYIDADAAQLAVLVVLVVLFYVNALHTLRCNKLRSHAIFVWSKYCIKADVLRIMAVQVHRRRKKTRE